MMKKILYVASVYDHLYTFHQPYIQFLKEKGHQVDVACNEILGELPNVNHHQKISFSRNLFTLDHYKSYTQLKEFIVKNNYDLIVCNTPIASAITRLVKKNSTIKSKIIYIAHGFHFYKGSGIISWLLFYPLEIYLTNYSDAVVTINEEDYSRISRNGNTRCDYYKIPGIGVNTDVFFPISADEKNKIKREFGFLKDDIIFVYAARFAKDKNHKFLIDVIKDNRDLFKNVKFLFAGKEDLENELKLYVEKNKLEQIIKFVGYREDIDKLYKISDFGISPSIREGLGLNLIEAMLCGLPVIATEQRGHKEIISDGKDGFLFPINDKFALISILKKILLKDFDYKKFSLNAIDKAKKFEINNTMTIMSKIFKDFL